MALTAPTWTLALSAALLTGGCVAVDRKAELREAEAEARFGPVGQIVRVDDTDVHVLVAGDGPDLVLIHGASGNLREWTFGLMEELQKDYRVFAFDRPGLGWTERLPAYRDNASPRAESPREQARLLQAAGAQLGLENPIVLGHSYGGAVALAWGLEFPDDTAALIALSAVSNPWPGGLSNLYRVNASRFGGRVIVPLISAFAPQSRIDGLVDVIFEPDPVPPGYARHIGAPLSLRRTALRANAQQIWTLRPHIVEMSALYRDTLTMPVEILHGTADEIVPAHVHADVLAKQLSDARYTRIEGLGHMPHHILPDTVLDIVDSAAERAGLRGAGLR